MNKSTATVRGSLATVVYGLASGLLALFLAFQTHRLLLPRPAPTLRLAMDALACVIVMFVCWFKMPANRPHLGALVLRVAIIWSLAIIALVMHFRSMLHGDFTFAEIFLMGSAATILFLGIVITFRTSWGKQWLLLRQKAG